MNFDNKVFLAPCTRTTRDISSTMMHVAIAPNLISEKILVNLKITLVLLTSVHGSWWRDLFPLKILYLQILHSCWQLSICQYIYRGISMTYRINALLKCCPLPHQWPYYEIHCIIDSASLKSLIEPHLHYNNLDYPSNNMISSFLNII